jgi:repressor LexA
MPLERLSDIQMKMFQFIVEYAREQGIPPTNREIGSAMNIPSTGHVDYHLKMLEKKGLIARESRNSRGIKLVQQSFGVPVMGTIAAGEPIDIFTDLSELLDVGRELEQQGTYALVVKGQSMIEDYICDKDYVVIKPQSTCENGDMVVAVHLQGNGRATLKRFFQEKERDRVRLQPANSEMDPIYVPKSEWNREWQIQGKVVAIFRKLFATENENISTVLDALKAGAIMSTEEDSKDSQEIVKEDIDRLTELVKDKLAGKPGNELLIDNYKNQPEAWQKTLRDDLAQVDVDQDKEILRVAKSVKTHAVQEDVFYDHIVTANNLAQERLDQIVE